MQHQRERERENKKSDSISSTNLSNEWLPNVLQTFKVHVTVLHTLIVMGLRNCLFLFHMISALANDYKGASTWSW